MQAPHIRYNGVPMQIANRLGAFAALLTLFGQGISGTANAQSYPQLEAGSTPYDVARFGASSTSRVGDVDGDGDEDIVLVDSSKDSLTLLYNDGNGRFHRATPAQLARRSFPLSWVELADIDRDGDLDILTPSRGGRDTWVYSNDGQGVFGAARPLFSTLHGASALTLKDVDGDKIPDLVLAVPTASFVCSTILYLGDGSGGYSRGPLLPSTDFFTNRIQVVDFDRDGTMDIVTTSRLSWAFVLMQTSKGVWKDESKARWPDRDTAGIALALDIDGDEDIDFAAIRATGLRLFRNNGQGRIGPAESTPPLPAVPLGVLASDFDEDGSTDLYLPLPNKAPVFLVRDGAALKLVDRAWMPSIQATHAALADFDQDGDVDIYQTETRLGEGAIERVFFNQRRDLRSMAAPLVGQAWQLRLRDRRSTSATALRLVFFATREQSPRIQLAPFGKLALDPATLFAILPARATLAGEAIVDLPIPDDARLRGVDIYAQALLGPARSVQDARLSARVTDWIR